MVNTVRLLICAFLLAMLHSLSIAQSIELTGSGGGEFTIITPAVSVVGGDADFVLWGDGQDLTIDMIEEGTGCLTLRGFGKITIAKKSGKGTLVIEEDNGSVEVSEMEGEGSAYLLLAGPKRVAAKDGTGNVHFNGSPPIARSWNGSGKSIRVEQPKANSSGTSTNK